MTRWFFYFFSCCRYRVLCVHLGEPPATFDWGVYAANPDGDGASKDDAGEAADYLRARLE